MPLTWPGREPCSLGEPGFSPCAVQDISPDKEPDISVGAVRVFLYFSFFCPPSFLFFGCNMPFVLFLQSHRPRLTFGQHHSAFLPLEISSLVQVQSFPRMQSKVSCSFSGQLWSTQSPEGHKALSCGGLTPLV